MQLNLIYHHLSRIRSKTMLLKFLRSCTRIIDNSKTIQVVKWSTFSDSWESLEAGKLILSPKVKSKCQNLAESSRLPWKKDFNSKILKTSLLLPIIKMICFTKKDKIPNHQLNQKNFKFQIILLFKTNQMCLNQNLLTPNRFNKMKSKKDKKNNISISI